MSERAIWLREFVFPTAAALILILVFSAGAVYGLNYVFDAIDQTRWR